MEFWVSEINKGLLSGNSYFSKGDLGTDKTQSEEKWEELSSCQSDLVEVQTAEKMFWTRRLQTAPFPIFATDGTLSCNCAVESLEDGKLLHTSGVSQSELTRDSMLAEETVCRPTQPHFLCKSFFWMTMNCANWAFENKKHLKRSLYHLRLSHKSEVWLYFSFIFVWRSYWRVGRRTESDEIGHVKKRRYGEFGIDGKDGGEEKQRKDERNSRQQHQQRVVAVPTPCVMAPRWR